jgi:hypothetical protein
MRVIPSVKLSVSSLCHFSFDTDTSGLGTQLVFYIRHAQLSGLLHRIHLINTHHQRTILTRNKLDAIETGGSLGPGLLMYPSQVSGL